MRANTQCVFIVCEILKGTIIECVVFVWYVPILLEPIVKHCKTVIWRWLTKTISRGCINQASTTVRQDLPTVRLRYIMDLGTDQHYLSSQIMSMTILFHCTLIAVSDNISLWFINMISNSNSICPCSSFPYN